MDGRLRPLTSVTRIGARLLFILGLVCLVAASWQVKSTLAFIDLTGRTQGMVVAQGSGSRGPLIRFTSPDGQVIDFEQHGLGPSAKPGQTVGVLFVAASPALAPRVESLIDLWLWAAVAGVAGLACLLAAWRLTRVKVRVG